MSQWRKAKGKKNSQQPTLPGFTDFCSYSRNEKNLSWHEIALETARNRLVILVVLFTLTFSAISVKLILLTIFSETSEQSAFFNTTSTANYTAARADIVDRNGALLATSLPTVSLCANTKNILDINEAADKLVKVLPGLDRSFLIKEFKSAKHCAVIKRHLTPRQHNEINNLGIAGIEFLPDESRIYPLGNLTSHVLGYTDIDNRGIAGIEKSFNERLNNNPSPLTLSLDLRLQTILHKELTNAVKEFQAEGASGIIIEPNSGEILSLVSLPDFDPQRAGQENENAKFNRASLGVYEMGSTFKIFTIALGLDSGLIKPWDRFDTINPIHIGGKTIRDFHPVQRALNVAEIFKESSNIGAARIAERLGSARMRAFLSRLGLTEKISFDLPETGSPLVPPASAWSNITNMTTAFGHGIAVNAIQLVSAVSAIVNGGNPIKPTLVKKESAKQKKEEPKNRIISAKTADQIRALMRLVVTRGTAKSANISGYLVGGKTGTADKIIGGKYNKNSRISSFIGVFPINDPYYLVFVMLDNPKGNPKTYGYATGGWTAAPVVGKVISQIAPLLGIPPENPEELKKAENRLLQSLGSQTLTAIMQEKEKDDYAAVESNSAE